MEIDRKMLENAAQLPEEDLKNLIYAVVTAAGGSKMQARSAASNVRKLKKKLENVSNEELKELTKNIDNQTMNNILEAVKKNGGI